MKLLLAIFLLVLAYSFAQGSNATGSNCWSKYQTEQQAIMMCEGESK